MRSTAIVGLALTVTHCAPSEHTRGSSPSPATLESADDTAEPSTRPAAKAPSTAMSAPGLDAGKAPSTGDQRATRPRSAFPPENIAPPHPRSAQPGDGTWTLLGGADDAVRASHPPRVLAKTQIHPHPTSRFITTTVVAIDLSRATIQFVPGTDDPKAKPPLTRKTGVIPTDDLDTALAVFNGGFQPRHGWWGMQADGRTLVRPRPDGCTLAILDDRSVTMNRWNAIEALGDTVVSYRQTPPCMIRDGEPSPLLTKNDRVFGGKNDERKTRRRSGIGINAEGTLLFFAIGEEGEARHLAEGLRIAGAHFAAQLDINWNWTRFLLIGDTEDGPRIAATLLSNMNHGKRQYVARPSQRDFFYVLPRPEGGEERVSPAARP